MSGLWGLPKLGLSSVGRTGSPLSQPSERRSSLINPTGSSLSGSSLLGNNPGILGSSIGSNLGAELDALKMSSPLRDPFDSEVHKRALGDTPKLPFSQDLDMERPSGQDHDEFTEQQLKKLRDQMAHMSNEVTEMRHEMKGMVRREEILQAELASEVTQRQELGSQFENSIKSMVSEFEALRRGISSNSQNIVQGQDDLTRKLVANDERLTKAFEEVCRQQNLALEAIESAERDRAKEGDKVRSHHENLLGAIEAEKMARNEMCQGLDDELRRVRHGLEEEIRKNSQFVKDHSNLVESHIRDTSQRDANTRKDMEKIVDQLEKRHAEVADVHRRALEQEADRHDKSRADLERQVYGHMEAKEKEHQAKLDKHHHEFHNGKKATEDALERGLKALYQSLERGLEKEAKDRQEQDRVNAQNWKAVLDQMTKDRDDAMHKHRIEQDEALVEHAKERHEALLSHHEVQMEHLAKERQIRDDGHKDLHNGLKALDIKVHRDAERMVQDQAEALKSLEHKLRADLIRSSEDQMKKMKEQQQAFDKLHGDHEQLKKGTDQTLRAALTEEQRAREKALADHGDRLKAHAGSMADLERKLRADLKQVDEVGSARHRDIEQSLRSDLEKSSNHSNARADAHKESLDKRVDKLEDQMQVALKDTQEALQMMMAEQNKNMSNEQDKLRDDLRKVSDSHEEKHKQTKDMLKAINDDHNDRHAQHGRALQDGIEHALDMTHKKLQEELYVLKTGVDGEHGSLRDVLINVTKQVDGLDTSLQKEHLARLANEDKVDKSIGELRRDVSDSLKEAHAALRLELADHGKNADDIKAALQDAHRALKNEINDHKVGSEKALRDQMAKERQQTEQSQEAHKRSMGEMEEKLRNDLKKLSDTHDDKHSRTKEMLADLHEQTKERHVKNAADLEDAFREGLANTHEKLREEMELLKSGHDNNHGNLRDVLMEVTKQVDALDQSMEKEQKLRLAVEERLSKECGELRRDIGDALKEAHAALRLELADHGKDSKEREAAMLEAHRALKQELNDHKVSAEKGVRELLGQEKAARNDNHEVQKRSLNELQDKIDKDLRKLHEAHDDKHKQTLEKLNAFNDAHHEKHVQNADSLEKGLTGALTSSHQKLQQELALLKSGQDANHGSLRDILTEVTKQVDVLEQGLEKEQKLRLAVEDRLDKQCNEMRRDIQDSLKESHAAIRMELAAHGKNSDEMKAAMQEAHRALKQELNDHKADSAKSTKDLLTKERQSQDDAHKAHKQTLTQLEDKLRNDLAKLSDVHDQKHEKMRDMMSKINDEHHEKHAMNAKNLEDGLSGALANTHRKLQEELSLLQSGVDGTHGNLREVMVEVTKQVDALDEALQKEQKMRLAVEERLDKTCGDLRRDISESMRETHAALRLELASLGKNGDEMKAAMQEAHKALKAELNDHKATSERAHKDLDTKHQNLSDAGKQAHQKTLGEMEAKLRNDLQKLADSHDRNHGELRNALQSVNDSHHEKHAQNAAALEDGISGALDKTHKKLQEELSILKKGLDGNHGNLSDVMMEVTKQVDNLEQTLMKEHKARLAVEDRLDKSCNELRREVSDSLKESHAALRLELAALGKNGDEMKAAMADAHKALKSELVDHKASSEKATKDLVDKAQRANGDAHDNHKKTLSQMEDKLRDDLRRLADNHEKKHGEMRNALEAVNDSHHQKHAQNAAALEDGISNALKSTHSKLQEELGLLKNGVDGNHGNLRDILTEVTKQVDTIDQTLQKEQKARLSVEERLDKSCNELRREIGDALKESHAALRMELAGHSKNADEMKAAMAEAHKALKNELGEHKVTSEKATRDLIMKEKVARDESHDAHKRTLSQMEDKLRNDLQKLADNTDKKHGELRNALETVNDSHHEKHAQNAAALEEGISGALKNTHKKLQDELELLRNDHNGNHGSLRDVLMEVTKQVDNIDQTLAKEQKARLAVEERLDKSCNELRRDMGDSLKESHAAIRLELASLGKNGDEMKAAMQEAHKALKGELNDHKVTAEQATKDLIKKEQQARGEGHDAHKKTMGELEAKLRNDLQRLADQTDKKHGELRNALQEVNDGHHDKHAQNAAALEDGISGALDKTHKKLQEELAILRNDHDGNHGNLRDVLMEVTKQVDTIDQTLQKEQKARLAVEERLDKACNELRGDVSDSLKESHAALQMELAALSKNGDEMKSAMMEAHKALKGELNDHKATSEKATKDLVDKAQKFNGEAHNTHKKTMSEMEAKLRNDLQKLADHSDKRHGELKSAMNEFNDSHHEKHAQNAAALEDGIKGSLDATHKKLQEELEILKNDHSGNHGSLRDVLMEVTKQVDTIDETLQKEQKARLAVEERLDKSNNEMRRDIGDSLRESHAAIRLELAGLGKNGDEMKAAMMEAHKALKNELNDHKVTSEKNTKELVDKAQKANGDSHDLHKKTMGQLEDKLRNDLQKLQDSHEKKHGDLKNALNDINDAHHEKHVQNAAALEDGIKNSLDTTHKKLQEELEILRNDHSGNHGSLRDVLMEVTKQVDDIDQSLQKEQKARLAVEDRLDKTCGELRRDVNDSLKESHAAIKLELAALNKNGDEMKAAMVDAHRALKKEFKDHQVNSEKATRDLVDRAQKATGDTHDLHKKTMGEMEQKLRNDLQKLADNTDKKHAETRKALEEVHDTHLEKHAQNATALEDGIKGSLDATHKKLQEELEILRNDHGGNHANLKDVLMEVTKQVDNIDQTLDKEQKARLAVEDRLDKSCNELRRDVSDSLKESHAALRMELASHSKNADEMKAAMMEAHKALSKEINDHKASSEKARKDLDSKHQLAHGATQDLHKKTLGEMEQKLRNDLNLLADNHGKRHGELSNALEEINRSHHEKHVQNASALEEGISGALDASHKKLQEEMGILRDMHDDNHGSLKDVLMEVTKQVDAIDQTLKGEQNARLAVEDRLDKSCGELRRDIADSLKESHAALRMELASHSKNADEMKAAMMDAHKALSKELNDHKVTAEKATKDLVNKEQQARGEHLDLHKKTMSEMEQKLRNDLQKLADFNDKNHKELKSALNEVNDAHHEKHAQNSAALEDGIKGSLDATHRKLQEELGLLKGMHDDNHGSLKDILMEVTKQVDTIDQTLSKEQSARLAVEERLDKSCNELRRDIGDSLRESHAALRMELAGHSKNADEMKAAMVEAHKALSKELNDHKVTSEKATKDLIGKEQKARGDHLDLHKKTLGEMEQKLRNDLGRLADQQDKRHNEVQNVLEEVNKNHHEKHAQNAAALEDGISGALDASHRKLQEELGYLKGMHDDNHGSLREILMEVTQQVDNIDQTLDKEQKARLAVEDRLDKACSEMRRDIGDSLKESHAALRMELAAQSKNSDEMKAAMMDAHKALTKELNDHKVTSEKSTKDLITKEQQARGEHMDFHKKTVAELEQKLRNDLVRLADNHEKKHADIKNVLEDVNKSHHEKHVQNANALEDGIKGALDITHKKLQEELELLKGGVGNTHDGIRDVLMEVTKQVDNLDKALEAEQKARLSVEERLDKSCIEMRRDIGDSLKESHAALKLELASLGKNGDEMKAAMAEAHKALKNELNDHKVTSEKATRDLVDKAQKSNGDSHDLHKKTMSQMEDKLRSDLQKLAEVSDKRHGEVKNAIDHVNDSHHQKHAQNNKALEEGISGALDSTHKKLQQELELLRNDHSGNHGSLRDILMEVTQQVDVIDQTVQKEQKARLAVEDRLDKSCGELKRDIDDALKESHAALRMELAAQSKNSDEMKAAMMDAHRALKGELNDHKATSEKATKDLVDKAQKANGEAHDLHKRTMGQLEDKLRKDLTKLADTHDKRHGEIRNALESVNDSHHQKHAQNASALEDGIKGALDNTHKKLQEELGLLRGMHDDNHGSLRDILMEVTKQVDTIDQTLEKEQKARLAVEDRLDKSCNELKKDIGDALKESHAALRMELASHGKNADEMKAAMMEAHKALKGELNDHKADSERSTRELINKEQQARGEHLDFHKKSMQDIEQKLRNDLQAVAENHSKVHKEIKSSLEDIHDHHVEKHAQNAAAFEDGISGALDKTHAKLQEEISLLKNSHDGNHGNLREILLEVTQQVDAIDQTLKTEQKARLAVEDRLDKSCNDMRRDINDSLQESHAALRMELANQSKDKDEMKAAMMDAHRVLKKELNDHKADAERSTKEILRTQSSHGDNHDYHKKSMTEMENKLRKDLDKLAETQDKRHGDLRNALDNINDSHHEKHAQNAAALEDGISGAIDKTHKKLQEELGILRNMTDGNHGSMRDVLMEVTKQVDNLDQTLQKEQSARLAVEDRLDKSCGELRRDINDSLRESHAALRMELASHGKNSDEMKAAMMEAHRALKQELVDHKVESQKVTNDSSALHKRTMSEIEDKLRNDLKAIADTHEKKHGEMQKKIDSMDDQHHEKHAQNSAKIEDGISGALATTHEKLQEEIKLMKNGVDGSHVSLRDVLMEVTKQVDVLDDTLQKEQKARLSVEERLDSSCNDLKREVKDALQESHAALRMELAAQSKNSDEMKAAMADAHRALKQELSDHKVDSANNTRDLITKESQTRGDAHAAHKKSLAELEEKVRNDLQGLADSHSKTHKEIKGALDEINDQHHEKHAQNAAKIEDGISGALSTTHQKLQEELNILKNGVDGSHGNLREVLMEVTRQVDNLDQTLISEQKARLAVEDRLDKSCNDMQRDIKDALRESHAALRMELASHSKNSDEMKAAMMDAHRALKQELTDHKVDADKNLREQVMKERQRQDDSHQANKQTLNQLEDKMRDDLRRLAAGHDERHNQVKDMLKQINDQHHEKHEKHVQNAAAMENGLSDTLKSTHEKLQEELSLLKSGVDGSHGNLRDILFEVTKQVDNLDQTLIKEQQLRMAVEERLDKAANELRRDIDGAMQEAHAAIHMELAAQSKDKEEMKAAMQEAHLALKSEISDHKVDAGSAHEVHKQTLAEMQQQLQNDLRRVADSHAEDHGNVKDLMETINREHHERHMQNEQKMETGISSALDSAHRKLQEEIGLLKSGVDDGHLNIRDVLTEVAKQVDILDTTLQQEQKNRLAVEERMDKVCTSMRTDIEDALRESHAALRMELASHGQDKEEMKAAMQEAHKALQQELLDHKDEFQKKHESHSTNMDDLQRQLKADLQSVSEAHGESHGQLKDMINSVNDLHHEKHATHREALEADLQQVLSSTHDKLAKDLTELRSGIGDGSVNIRQILTDVTAQVEALTSSLEAESGMRVSLEDQLKQQNAALKEEMDVALKEAHSALHLQLAEHGKNASEIEAAMKEAHSALKQELNMHKDEFGKHRDAFDSHKDEFGKHKDEFDSHKGEFDSHKNEFISHKGEFDNHRTKLVEGGKLGEVEERLQAAMQDLHAKHEAHSSSVSELEKQLREDLGRLDDNHKAHGEQLQQFADHHGKHHERHSELTDMYTSTNKALEEGLDSVLNTAHQKLADDLKQLSQGVEGSQGGVTGLRDVLTEVTKEVDALTFSLQAEKGLRQQMEEKLRDNITEIRRELEEVFNEAHAALRLELASQSKDAGEMQAALRDAHEALKSEIEDHRGKFDTHTSDYVDKHMDMRTQIQSELSMLKSGVDTHHNSLRDRMAELTGQIDGLAASLHAEQTLRSDAEERLEQRTTALEHKMRREVQENLDESSAKQREVTRELRDSIHNFNNENHARHLKLQSMIDGHIQGVISTADQKLKRSLEELKEGIDQHNATLKDHLGQERSLRENNEHKFHAKMNESIRQLKDDNEALRKRMNNGDPGSPRGRAHSRDVDHGPLNWEEEAKRLWEAIDTHTHDVAVEDVEEERQVRTQFIRQEVPITIPALSTTNVLPATPLPTSITRIPRSPVGGHSPIGARFSSPPRPAEPVSVGRVIPATPLGSRSLSNERKMKCGNCPNLLSIEENFCRKCGWEKPIHGPPLLGTSKILHNVPDN